MRHKIILSLLLISMLPVNVYAAEESSTASSAECFSSNSYSQTNNMELDMDTEPSGISSAIKESFNNENTATADINSQEGKASEISGNSSFSGETLQTEPRSDIEKYQDAFDQSRELMKKNLPTLETQSLDDMRNELTESVKNNASSTLKELMGDSFSGLDSNLFNISGMPSTDISSIESLNVHYAEMREAFEKSSAGISGSLDKSSSGTNENKIGSLDTELKKWRKSSSYKTISGKISISDVFGSLEKQLPSNTKKK